MAIRDEIRATVLATRVIASVDDAMMKQFNLKKEQRCIGMITADSDDVTTSFHDAVINSVSGGVEDHIHSPRSSSVITSMPRPGTTVSRLRHQTIQYF